MLVQKMKYMNFNKFFCEKKGCINTNNLLIQQSEK